MAFVASSSTSLTIGLSVKPFTGCAIKPAPFQARPNYDKKNNNAMSMSNAKSTKPNPIPSAQSSKSPSTTLVQPQEPGLALSRRDLLVKSATLLLVSSQIALYSINKDLFTLHPAIAQAARSTIGGLGTLGVKSPSVTGVYRSSEVEYSAAAAQPGVLVDELLASDSTPVLVSFNYPPRWSISVKGTFCDTLASCTDGNIDAKDNNSSDNAFVLVAPVSRVKTVSPTKIKNIKDLPTDFFTDYVFATKGKYGVYGQPEDVKVISDAVSDKDKSKRQIECKFNAFTPNQKTVAKRLYVTGMLVGSDVFMVVAATNANRWNSAQSALQDICDSFRAVPAPKSARPMKRGKEIVEDNSKFVLPEEGYAEGEDDFENVEMYLGD